ncbi:tRNA (guanine-N(1)-)-methyltransferase [Wickerhamomyces ciferrii]|uniref:tRNA (guanine(37)-N1)-methyltransferase n=1 Tax=Wickerhamomyces ciferrii (strain ATCC 14091 / BCRC 22168 / CBS 111 / JCM 3599 / NBRC 0793 / NRRL Y-1031 F-60-10) TaxID=1206466 RepID=K0KQA4_WICCF|nr:tRNA (guanine-N(1)-)-methyltransferase [Wickerhamomyces ciferrii]CCH45226.1 tRNA (guanine-N(1)-)-methyltransferase [Wickerhamomyces ciferrii]
MVTHNCSLDLSPPINREMKELDTSFFRKEFPVIRARFDDPRIIQKFIRSHPQDVLSGKGLRNIVKIGDYTVRAVLLTDRLTKISDASKILSESCLEYFKKEQIPLQNHTLVIDYDFWSTEEILGAILPEDLLDNIPSGFSQTGHVAHLNLRDEYKPYKKLIGEVVLSKNPSIETVVDKVDSIATEYRTFKMEVLAGKPDLLVTHKEQNCIFQFDFEKVYWNSRLQAEHERLVQIFKPGELVLDAMAGVGPFTVPAAKKGVISIANDLNPDSYHFLKQNIAKNNVSNFIKPFNDNGHDFIKNCMTYIEQFHKETNGIIKVEIKKPKTKSSSSSSSSTPANKKPRTPTEYKDISIPKFPNHFVMNLPDSAIEFVNDYIGIFANHEELKSLPNFELPMVHVYCFQKFSPDEPEPTEKELESRVRDRIVEKLQYNDLKIDDINFKLIRKVSPTKPMYRASFRLPEEVAFKKV